MSRSHYVYVVMESGKPKAAFTVKWEMEGWLETEGNITPLTDIYRVPDRAQSANREGVNITDNYSHLFPRKPTETADA